MRAPRKKIGAKPIGLPSSNKVFTYLFTVDKQSKIIQSFVDIRHEEHEENHDTLKISVANTLLGADGNSLLTDKDAMPERWVGHFVIVLNYPSCIDAIDRLPQVENTVLLDEFSTLMETRTSRMKKFKICHLAKLQGQMKMAQTLFSMTFSTMFMGAS